jgi:hypothetical protein
LLLAHPKINPNIYSYNGDTPFMLVCQTKHLELIPLFLNHPKFDLSIKNKNNKTAISYFTKEIPDYHFTTSKNKYLASKL